MIVQTDTILTLLGGAPTQEPDLERALELAPILVAADGGADFAVASGYRPQAVIGDMDSISDLTKAQIPQDQFHLIAEQDSTDFDKCLRNIDAPAILALGFVGGRMDHGLAACTTLVRRADKTCILIGDEDICFVPPERFSIELPHGTVFSLFPMAPVTGKSTGLQYPIDGLALSPTTRGGTSNSVVGPISVTLPGRTTLVILPKCHLERTLDALLRTD